MDFLRTRDTKNLSLLGLSSLLRAGPGRARGQGRSEKSRKAVGSVFLSGGEGDVPRFESRFLGAGNPHTSSSQGSGSSCRAFPGAGSLHRWAPYCPGVGAEDTGWTKRCSKCFCMIDVTTNVLHEGSDSQR